MTISRRTLIKGAAAAGGLAALGSTAAHAVPTMSSSPRLPDLGLPANAPIDHIVVVMMENRSFDHFLGWVPGSISDRTRTYVDTEGVEWQPYHLAPDFQGCGHPDPGHGWSQGRAQLGESRDASGFLAEGSGNDELAVGYYDGGDIPVWQAIVEQGTIFDNYFAATLTSTWPNRSYMHGATSSGRQGNSTSPSGYPEKTIWDALEEAHVSWAYYYSNLPFIGLYGPRMVSAHADKIRHVAQYHADAAAGQLPMVCFVDPVFTTPAEGFGNDDHPLADVRLGQQFLSEVIRSFTQSTHFASGALFVNYDEWGGFFDTVIPDIAPDEYEGFGQRGFRTPAAVISPFARKGAIASQLLPRNPRRRAVYDHTSILKFIEWRFGLAPLAMRDAAAANIGELLDFSQDRVEVEIPAYSAPPDAYNVCAVSNPNGTNAADGEEGSEWDALRESGWFEHVGLRTDYTLRDSWI